MFIVLILLKSLLLLVTERLVVLWLLQKTLLDIPYTKICTTYANVYKHKIYIAY